MTDEQLERRFSVVNEALDPDPRFATDLFAELTDRLGLEPSTAPRSIQGPETLRARRAGRGARPWRTLLVAALLAVGVASAALLAGSLIHRDDLLTRLGATGVLRFAIRPDFPQAAVPVLAGFDIDVGKALAARMGLRDEPVHVAFGDMIGDTGDSEWDVGLPSSLLTAEQTARFTGSDAYYYWPVRLLVPAESAAVSASDLGGVRICVVAGSSGEAWLSGRLPSGAEAVVAAPSSPVIRTEAADRDCVAAVTRGDADAMVTSTFSDSDLAARPTLRTVGGPLFFEPRTIVASREGPDPSALVTAIDAALGAMRSDGTLADLSRNRFGGSDLTNPPRTP